MTNNRIISNTQAFNFATYSIKKSIATGSLNTVYQATSYGDIIGATGFRIWDTSQMAASGTAAITPTNPFTAPLISNNLPATQFDAIIDFNIDNISYPLAFSNSPDNRTQYTGDTIVDSTNLYWINLARCRPNAPVTSAQSNINYYFGGDPLSYGGQGEVGFLKLNLLSPLTQSTTFSYTMEYVSFNNQILGPWSGSITLAASNAIRNITIGDFPIGMSGNPVGHMKITVNCSNPSFRSLLPIYHWGLAT